MIRFRIRATLLIYYNESPAKVCQWPIPEPGAATSGQARVPDEPAALTKANILPGIVRI